MATIPPESQNWFGRSLKTFGPLRVEGGNPQQGEGGPEVSTLYGYTVSNEKFCLSFGQNGKLKQHSEGTIEIVAGSKDETEQGETIILVSETGNVTIKANKNGAVKISGKNVTIEADEELSLVGNTETKIRSSGAITQNSNVNIVKAHSGNALSPQLTFLYRVFDFSLIAGIDPEEAKELGVAVGEDVLKALTNTVSNEVNPFT